MNVIERVRPLAQKAAEDSGAELWDVEFLREGPHWVLRVTIDRSEGGVDLDMCERVSRALDPLLDEADPIPQSYMLEVSSAGVERILRNERDYERYLGQYAEVRLFKPIDGSKEHLGHLRAFDADTLTLDDRVFPRGSIAQVRLRLKM